MSQSLILGVRDQFTRVSASGRRPTHITPEPIGASCGWWTYRRMGPCPFFRLCPGGPYGLRPRHQMLALRHPPQAWLQGGTLGPW